LANSRASPGSFPAPSTTLAIYAHKFKTDDGKAAAAINAVLPTS